MEQRTLGDYKLVKEIGSGTLGSTYVAEHRFLRRHFALKLFSHDFIDAHFIERFEKHSYYLSDWGHHNIAPVHNFSSVDGVYFLVSDLILDDVGHPTNLSQYLHGRSHRMTEEEIIVILRQIAKALESIHGKIIDEHPCHHGNLKLTNVLMGKKKEGVPEVFLADAGLFSLFAEEKQWEAIVRFGSTKRTFLQNYGFLSPEQKCTIKTGELSPASDVYAFGVVAYFLLTGEYPDGLSNFSRGGKGECRYNWEYFFSRCLCHHPADREVHLNVILDHLLQKELDDVKQTLSKPTSAKVFSFETSRPAVREMQQGNYMQQAFSQFEEQKEPVIEKKKQPEEPSPHEKIESRLVGQRKMASKLMKDPLQEQLQSQKTALMEKRPILNPSELKKLEYEEDPGAIFQTELVVERYIPKKKEITDVQPILTDMAIIEEGEYIRGSDVGARDEKPRHKIFLRSFALDIHPVTNEQFIRFLELMGGEKDSNNNDMIYLKEARIKRLGGKLIVESGYAKHPVVGVSWYGAVAYAKWVGKRLPTEAEWEIAASSGSPDRIYPYGIDIERSQANFFSSDTTAVKSYPPNDSGLYDMVGNVYEWCSDWYDYNFYESSLQEPLSPQGPVQGVYRVLRGGCWKSLKEDLRCSHRHRNNPGTVNRTYGFRCAADVS